jgi:hypothetical protein
LSSPNECVDMSGLCRFCWHEAASRDLGTRNPPARVEAALVTNPSMRQRVPVEGSISLFAQNPVTYRQVSNIAQ